MGASSQLIEPETSPALIHTYEHRAYALPDGRAFTVGRDSECDIRVNEVAVSRRHVEIEHDASGNFTLVSVGSTPTLVNGEPLAAPHPLRNGDSFTVGTMRFTFTTDRLPTGMGFAQRRPLERKVEDRRPTVTFPTQPGIPLPVKKKGNVAMWLVPLILVVAIGAAAAWFVLLRHA